MREAAQARATARLAAVPAASSPRVGRTSTAGAHASWNAAARPKSAPSAMLSRACGQSTAKWIVAAATEQSAR